jgi:hypothetical protein
MQANQPQLFPDQQFDAAPTPERRTMALATGDAPTLAGLSARALGAYYTPTVAASFMARWTVRNSGDRILEPSMGDGAFLHAVSFEAERREMPVEKWGVELAFDTFQRAIAAGAIDREHAIRDDFLAVHPFEVDAVIGNPPYVRLRHLPADESDRALTVASQVLGSSMDTSGSVWMPFVLQASRFLSRGGRLALVLPYDFTYVRYARPLWEHLGRHFASIRLLRLHERMFPDINQEVVLLLADGNGGSTSHVAFEAYFSLAHLERGVVDAGGSLSIDDIAEGERSFLHALLPADAQDLLRYASPKLKAAREFVTFNIGYVCGDKDFFHPPDATVRSYELPCSSLIPSATSSRQLTGTGLWTSNVPVDRRTMLFRPSKDPASHTEGERRYIERGERAAVDQRYKCRVRRPWYVTPGVKVPDVIVPVFTERPTMAINDGQFAASNSLLCGYLQRGSAEELAARWYTSLTLLQLELEVHSLGGGVFVLVPQEAGNIKLPSGRVRGRAHLADVDACVRRGDHRAAFERGDDALLTRLLGLGRDDVGAISEGVEQLVSWRTSARSPAKL